MPGRGAGIKRLRARRRARRHGARQIVHRAEMRRAEGQRVQQLQRERRGEPRHQPHQAPAHDPGRTADDHQPERPDPRAAAGFPARTARSRRRPPRPTKRRSPVGKPERAPIQRAEPVIDLVACLQRRGDRDKPPEAPVAGHARRARASAPARPVRGAQPASRGSAANSMSEAPSTKASTALPPRSVATRAGKHAPLAIAATMKLTEPQTRTRP